MCCPVNRTRNDTQTHATKRPLTCDSVGNTFKFNPFTCLLVVQGKQIPMMSGNDIVKLFKRLKRREKKHGTIRKIKPVATPEVDADMHVEGSVEIAPVSGVPNDAVDEAVETAKGATSRLLMPPPMLSMAASKDPSIVFKKLCDIELPGFAVDSHRNVRFRERDGKVFAPDLLVQMGKSKTISDANDVILKLVKDGTVKDLHSLEVDDKFLVLANKSLILMSLPDAIKLLHRLDVRTMQEGVIMPEIEMVSASEAVQNAVMPQIQAAAASDGMQAVDMPQIEGVSASIAMKDPVMSPTEVAAASGAAKNDFVPPMAVASGAARPVAVKIRMRKVQASVLKTISGFQDLDDSRLNGKEVRQVESGQVDAKGTDISGLWNLADVGAAYLYDDPKNAIRWAKGITTADANSLIKIQSGNPSVS